MRGDSDAVLLSRLGEITSLSVVQVKFHATIVGAVPWQSSIRKVFVDFHGIVPGVQANVIFHVCGNVIFHSIAKRPARARCSCPC